MLATGIEPGRLQPLEKMQRNLFVAVEPGLAACGDTCAQVRRVPGDIVLDQPRMDVVIAADRSAVAECGFLSP
jgi:hypothetical protein